MVCGLAFNQHQDREAIAIESDSNRTDQRQLQEQTEA